MKQVCMTDEDTVTRAEKDKKVFPVFAFLCGLASLRLCVREFDLGFG
jgi:hypothetical protein